MNKTQLIDAIKERKTSLDALKARLEKSAYLSIPGHLTISTTRGTVRYYCSKGSEGRTYLNNSKQIEDLAMKAYHECLLESSRREGRQMEQCLLHLQNGIANTDIDKAYMNLKEPIRRYVKPEAITDDGYAHKWLSRYKGMTKKDSSHTHKTLKGDYVRSKSEAMIADRFFHFGIPYVYEQASFFDEERAAVLHPDFLILNKRKRREYFWEHCGRIDDPKYANDTLHRLKVFSGQGYLLGKNLIFTYETNESHIDMEYVDQLINEFLR